MLVVEDDVRPAAVLEQTLLEAGWDVEVVHDGWSTFDLDELLARLRALHRRTSCDAGQAAGNGSRHGALVSGVGLSWWAGACVGHSPAKTTS